MLVVGLANSGKTSIVQALKAERSLDDTVPTVGFSVERFHMLNTMLTVVDMSGQPKYQKLWECYYDDVQVVGSLLHQRCRLHGACTFQAPADACTAQSLWLRARVGHRQRHMQQPGHCGAETRLLTPGGCGAAPASLQRC